MLQKTLESFQWLKYSGQFEVVVVNGPSTDNSDEIIASWLPRIRAGRCDVANLSVSRNVGICMARGDIVAFIDDDAVPEPEWLEQMAAAYRDPQVGAVGGFVFNHTGYEYQYKYCLVDRFGNADLSPSRAFPHLSFPKSGHFPHLLGCNSSFRRSALLKIGGFDEEYEYFLDETDVCLRIIDAGYLIEQLPNAFVHHKYAPSNIRGDNKVVRYRYPVIKNKIYFMLKHAREFHPLDRIIQERDAFVQRQQDEVDRDHGNGFISSADAERFSQDLVKAIEVGSKRGFEGVLPDAMITPSKRAKYAGTFLPFTPIQNPEFKTLVFVSRDFPPGHNGGIATFNKDLAEALAAKGNLVHVITQSPDINRVDFENGVWVHRMASRDIPRSEAAVARNVPQSIWNWSATAFEEVERIGTHHPVDVVEAPIWDCEGIAFLLARQWPLVTSLQTTLRFFLDHHPELESNPDWMRTHGTPMLALERELIGQSDLLRSISSAIRKDIEAAYGCSIPDERVCIAHLGMPDLAPSQRKPASDDAVEILFVGRLEPRKGIDVLLEAIPEVLRQFPNATLRIVGDDTLPIPGQRKTYKETFLRSALDKTLIGRVHFDGRVSDAQLLAAYEACDVFVAPSRFESFGLIFLEAMRAGKPVVGCAAGGMPELIEDGQSGYLVPPGDAAALGQALMVLAGSKEKRRQMGERGRMRFLTSFTSEAMAQRSVELIARAMANFGNRCQ